MSKYERWWRIFCLALRCDRQDRMNVINVQTPGERDTAQRRVCLLEESNDAGTQTAAQRRCAWQNRNATEWRHPNTPFTTHIYKHTCKFIPLHFITNIFNLYLLNTINIYLIKISFNKMFIFVIYTFFIRSRNWAWVQYDKICLTPFAADRIASQQEDEIVIEADVFVAVLILFLNCKCRWDDIMRHRTIFTLGIDIHFHPFRFSIIHFIPLTYASPSIEENSTESATIL